MAPLACKVLGQSPPALLKQVPTWVNKGGAKRKPTGMTAVDPNIHLKATAVIFLSFFSLLRSGGEQVASKLSRCFSRETFQGRGKESEGLLGSSRRLQGGQLIARVSACPGKCSAESGWPQPGIQNRPPVGSCVKASVNVTLLILPA